MHTNYLSSFFTPAKADTRAYYVLKTRCIRICTKGSSGAPTRNKIARIFFLDYDFSMTQSTPGWIHKEEEAPVNCSHCMKQKLLFLFLITMLASLCLSKQLVSNYNVSNAFIETDKYYKQGTKSIHIWHLSLDIEHPTGIVSPF